LEQARNDARNTSRFASSPVTDHFLDFVDARSREARRYIDVLDGLLEHLGGAETAGQVRLHLARRASALITWAESQEARLIIENSPAFDATVYATGINTLRRLLLDLGLNPALRDVTPNLMAFLSANDDVTDVEAEPKPEPEIVRFDSRGRPLRGTPEQCEKARHMREVAAQRKAEREVARKAALKAAREAVAAGATKVALPDPEPPRRPQSVRRGF
jgi:hypothetical protein